MANRCSNAAAVTAALALSLAAVAAQAPDRSRTEAQAARTAARLQSLQREADQLAAEERTVLGDLRKLEIERQLRAEELRQADDQAAAAERSVQGAANDI